MRIIFMGSAELACPSLDRLLDGEPGSVVAVVTQPDRPKGRTQHLAPCPVRAHAARVGVPVLTPERVNAPESVAVLRALAPDLVVVVAYGQILKRPILDLPPLGCVNVHASLLPRYRGAAPIQWAVAHGDPVTGVTSMFMSEGLDAGDIIDRVEEPIGPEDTAGTLHDRLALRGADLLAHTLERLRAGAVTRIAQDAAAATLAPKLRKADGLLDWRLPADALRNRIRGFNPWPGCYFVLPGPAPLTVRVHRARVEEGGTSEPGRILAAGGDGPLVQCGQGALRLLDVQPEARKAMSGAAFLCGHPLQVGNRLPGG